MAVTATLNPDRCSRADPTDLKAAVDRRLRTLLPGPARADDLAVALRYSLLAPGKRLRPMLTVLAAWELGSDDLSALDAGCALEMVHAASLILDDMPAMDNARERRGQPATHLRFGEDVAMLTAMTLLSLAYGTIGRMHHVPSETRCRLVEILAEAVGPEGLAGGQLADLRPQLISSVQAAAEANRRKTGALFEAAASIAAAIAEAPEGLAERLRRCAGELGQAYQILDDLSDGATSSAAVRSEDDGKSTILSIVGVDTTHKRLWQHLDAALLDVRPASPLALYVRDVFGERVAVEPA